AATRAEGPDLVLKVVKPVKLAIPAGSATKTKIVKLAVSNQEFGATAPATRTYRLSASNGSCPGGTVTQLDTDYATPGLQATSAIAKGAALKGSLVVTVHLEDITTVSSKVPFRCTFTVTATALDTVPDVDDAANPENNSATVDLEVSDAND